MKNDEVNFDIERMKIAMAGDRIQMPEGLSREEMREFIVGHARKVGQCECHACIAEFDLKGPGGVFPLSSQKMILCPNCGNKRCPRASDHRLQCTDSNEPGQPGSVYG